MYAGARGRLLLGSDAEQGSAAPLLSAEDRIVVCVLGAALTAIGLLVVGLVSVSPELSGALNPSAGRLPLVPGFVAVLGIASLSVALMPTSRAVAWVARTLLIGVALASAVAIFVETPFLEPLRRATLLWIADGPFSQFAADAAFWLLFSSVSLLLGTWNGVRSVAKLLAVLLAVGASFVATGLVFEISVFSDRLLLGLFSLIVAQICASSTVRLTSRSPESAVADRFFVSALDWLPFVAGFAMLAVASSQWGIPVAVTLALSVFVPIAIAVAVSVRKLQGRETALDSSLSVIQAERDAARAIEDAAEVGSWTYESKADVLSLSEPAARIFQTSIRAGSAQAMSEHIDPVDRPRFLAWLLQAAASGTRERTTVKRAGDERWLELSSVPGSSVIGVVRDVTCSTMEAGRNAARTDLLERVASANPDLQYIYDLRTKRYVYSNRPNGVLVGRPNESDDLLLRKSVLDQDRAGLLEYLDRVNSMESNDWLGHEFRVRRDDGSVEWILTRASVLTRDESSEPVLIFGTAQVVSARRELEAALVAAEAKYERLASRVPGVVFQFVVDASGSFQVPRVGEGVAEMFGVSPEEIGRAPGSALGRIVDEDRQTLLEAIESSRVSLLDFQWTGRVSQPDGSLKWVEAFSRPVRREDGSTLWDGVVIDVSESKEARTELEALHDRFQELLVQTSTVVYECEPHPPYRIRSVASNVRALAGYVPEQLAGRAAFGTEFVHDADRELFRLHHRRFVDHGTSTAEYRLRTLSGDYVWVKDDVRIVSSGSDETLVQGSWTDITEYRRAKERTVASEARLLRLTSRMPGMVFELALKDARPEFTFVSSGSYELIGVPPEEVRLRPEAFFRTVQDDDKSRLYREIIRAGHTGEDLSWEGRVVLLGGREKRVRIAARSVASDEAHAIWAGVATDVTDDRAFDHALSEEELRYAALTNSMSEAVLTVTAAGKIVSTNPAFERLAGYLSHELVGQPLAVLSPQDGEFVLGETDAGRVKKDRVRHRDGRTVEVDITVSAFERKSVRHYTAIVTRAMERKEVAVPKAVVQTTERPAEEPPIESSGVVVIASEADAESIGRSGKWPATELTIATTPGLGLELAKKNVPDALVFVSNQAGPDVAALIEAVRADESLGNVPIVVAGVEDAAGARLLRLGASAVAPDYEAALQALDEILGTRKP